VARRTSLISDIYARGTAKAADFITIRRCSTAFWSPGKPEEDHRHQHHDVRCGGSREYRFVEVPLVQALIPQCKRRQTEPTLQLYDNTANCIQAILAGRADTYVNASIPLTTR